ncbi:MAG TPA: primosomal protein N' [Candidatus Binatus sp.]|uniref:replication restart helicase PriA n=1 Tax=Candidatus Binatus sp. TaxID=2811406 RepID=UPI002B470151|nr:primosomal protein N' [Candidatus Binatus sp.]HKN13531.1 primosomal protein N' [Candidatus Binatus sp.]
MQANIVIVGATRGFETLTYAIPPALDGLIQPGHRVLAPLRSRKVTGLVTEVGERLSPAQLKPILEVLEPRPLFDRAHLQLMEFLASYYMVSIADAYRSVIPAVARVESRAAYTLATPPNALARAAFTRIERAIIETIAKRAATTRQLEKVGPPSEVRATIARFVANGILERRDATTGRHRDTADVVARLVAGASIDGVRGSKQREVLSAIANAGAAGVRVEDLKTAIDGASAALKSLTHRGLIAIDAAPVTAHGGAAAQFDLTEEQQIALEAVSPAIEQRRYQAFLLWGVTASGKTEIYLNLAARALAAGRNVLIMVPEIALADEIVRSFRARFGSLVGIAHSAQSVSERWASWMAALGGQARVMIGPRSVIFAPIHDIGLIVVDEEHDASYKNEEGIYYHARDLAVALAGFSKCPVVLGSATPSSESYANARRGRYRLLSLSRRVNDRAMASVEIVDMRREVADARKLGAAKSTNGAGPAESKSQAAEVPETVPLSTTLVAALRENLASGGQSMVFLNRRGFHNFLQCHICGNVIACPDCSVSMTFHMRDLSLRCHYCGNHTAAPDTCPECKGYGLQGQGFGTERLTQTLAEMMPAARIERMDSDTSSLRGARARMLADLRAGEIDILVGTQMITKGFDFPGVTLAAVVNADLALNMPDFRSAERTFQLLTQIAGRAGRGERPGRVIIQTFAPNHYSVRAAKDQDYARFMRRELELRRDLMYPPFARLAMVRIEGAEPQLVQGAAEAVAKSLAKGSTPEGMRVLGPAPAPIERIKQRYRWQVMLKSRELKPLRAAIAAMRAEVGPSAERDDIYLAIDIDPVRML